MFLHVNILWPAVAAAVNRDGSNNQKTTLYGGSRRARWSSQSQKNPTRAAFRSRLAEQATAVRTRTWDGVADRLTTGGWDPRLAEAAAKWTAGIAGGGEGGALVMVRSDFAEATAQALIARADVVADAIALSAKKPGADAEEADKAFYQQCADRKKTVEARFKDKDARKEHQAHLQDIVDTVLSAEGNVDIAFNGRMIAENDGYNIDAAVHVGHAISVDPWEEHAWDYFTAVDDLTGTAGMLGERPNGTVLYFRTAVVDLAQAHATLGGDWAAIVDHTRLWADAFCRALPVSMQSSTAATSAPVLAGATATISPPANLAPFCADPIIGNRQYQRSGARLLDYHQSITTGFGIPATMHYWTPLDLDRDNGTTEQAHPTWMQALDAACTSLRNPETPSGE